VQIIHIKRNCGRKSRHSKGAAFEHFFERVRRGVRSGKRGQWNARWLHIRLKVVVELEGFSHRKASAQKRKGIQIVSPSAAKYLSAVFRPLHVREVLTVPLLQSVQGEGDVTETIRPVESGFLKSFFERRGALILSV